MQENETRSEAPSGTAAAPRLAVPPPPGPSLDKPGVEVRLDEIAQLLRQQIRLQQSRDFSVARMFAYIAQILVVGLALWTVISLADTVDLDMLSSITFRLFGAILLQLFALTLFVLDRQDR